MISAKAKIIVFAFQLLYPVSGSCWWCLEGSLKPFLASPSNQNSGQTSERQASPQHSGQTEHVRSSESEEFGPASPESMSETSESTDIVPKQIDVTFVAGLSGKELSLITVDADTKIETLREIATTILDIEYAWEVHLVHSTDRLDDMRKLISDYCGSTEECTLQAMVMPFSDEDLRNEFRGIIPQFVPQKLNRDAILDAIPTMDFRNICILVVGVPRDYEIILEAMRRFGGALAYVDGDLRKNYEINLAAATETEEAFQHVVEDLWRNPEFNLAVLARNSRAFKYLHEDLRHNYEFNLAAFTQNATALQYVHEDLRHNYELNLAVVTQNPTALQYVDEDLRHNYEFNLAAVTQNWIALGYVDADLVHNYELNLAAVTQNPSALHFYVAVDLQRNHKFNLAAVTQNPKALLYVHEDLRHNHKFNLAAVTQNPKALQYVVEDLRHNLESLK